jgi:hypothetical protein
MQDESFKNMEQCLANVRCHGAPVVLRDNVLCDVHRELLAARWDRRLARAAVILLIVGAGMNAAVLFPERAQSTHIMAVAPRRDSLVQLAMSVAEATDLHTGQQVARRLAAMTGRPLSGEDAAAIDAAVERQTTRTPFTGKEG